MLRDFYLQIANEMMDYADERIEEAKKFTEKAEYYVKMADDCKPEELYACLKAIKREHKITAEKIANNMGLAPVTVSQMLYKSKNITLSKLTKYLEGMNMDLVIFDPKGVPHKLAKREYFTRGGRPFFENKHGYFKRDDDPNVFFNK